MRSFFPGFFWWVGGPGRHQVHSAAFDHVKDAEVDFTLAVEAVEALFEKRELGGRSLEDLGVSLEVSLEILELFLSILVFIFRHVALFSEVVSLFFEPFLLKLFLGRVG